MVHLSSLDGRPIRDAPSFSILLFSLSQSPRPSYLGSSLLGEPGVRFVLYLQFLSCLFTDVTDTSGDAVVKVSQQELDYCEALWWWSVCMVLLGACGAPRLAGERQGRRPGIMECLSTFTYLGMFY